MVAAVGDNHTWRMDTPRSLLEDMKDWSRTRLNNWLSTVHEDPAQGNANWWRSVRWIPQSHAYRGTLTADERRDWARTMLAVSEHEQHFGWQQPWSAAHERFMMRAYVILNIGSPPGEEIREPAALARDVLETLTMAPDQAQELAERWRTVPIEQIRLLRDHKNMLSALPPGLVDLIPEGDLLSCVRRWLAIRPQLP